MATATTPDPELLAELADVQVLEVHLRRWATDRTTWAWDTYDEACALHCGDCGEVSDYFGAESLDGDACRCGSANTVRVVIGPSREHTATTC